MKTERQKEHKRQDACMKKGTQVGKEEQAKRHKDETQTWEGRGRKGVIYRGTRLGGGNGGRRREREGGVIK